MVVLKLSLLHSKSSHHLMVKTGPHPGAHTWSFLQTFKSMRHILPYPQSLQLQAKTRSILHILLQLLWHRSPFGPDVYPFFLPPTPLTDAPFSLSPQTPCLFCFSPFFYVEHLVLTVKCPVLRGVTQESHFPPSRLVLLLHNKSKAYAEHAGCQAGQ